MLSALPGNTHQVYTGVCILFSLTQEEIWNYIHEEKPFDKAGAYGIEGESTVFVEKIQGDFFNVAGFPAVWFVRKMRHWRSEKGSFQSATKGYKAVLSFQKAQKEAPYPQRACGCLCAGALPAEQDRIRALTV